MRGFPKAVALLLIFAAAFGGAAGCGRKAPPFLPRPPFTLFVSNPAAAWVGSTLTIQGEIRAQQDQPDAEKTSGARVYYVRYPLGKAPCEGCPVSYQGYRELRGRLVSDGSFRSRVNLQPSAGIWYFEIRLLGPDGQLGPPSERVRVVVQDAAD